MAIQHKATLDQLKTHSGEWLTVKDLAEKLGIHPDTVRRWENKGRISSVRHPINNYRLFLWSEIVQEVLNNEPRSSYLRSRVI
ncbi:MAG: MerR family DNA-binding transcriptional regulator [Bdellovibrionota bacterium]